MKLFSGLQARWMVVPLLVTALTACSEQGAGDRRTGDAALQGAGAAPQDTIDLRTIGYSIGADDAPVQVFEFSDFGCPFCGMFARGTFPELSEEFVASGQVRWTYVPVTFGFGGGREGARAAECAAEQGQFWEMHDIIYENQNEWKASNRQDRMAGEFAGQIGLDRDSFTSCFREDGGAARTAVHNQAAAALGVRATPSFFINGRLVEGALPAEQFRQVFRMMGATE